MAERSRFGSDLIVDLLQAYGIEYAALNPGASYRGLHDSLVNYGHNRPQIIQCTHEKIAIGLAHGYAKATGKPMVAIVHDVVGLLHGALGIYYAYLDRVPVLVLGATGPMEASRRRPTIDWIHTAVAQGSAVRDYTKWDYQPVGAEDVADSFARAYRVATTDPQGPVYLCYDSGFQEDPLTHEVAIPAPEQITPTRPQADPRALDRLAHWLVEAEQPVLAAEYLGRRPQSGQALVALAEFLGAPVLDLGHRWSFPNVHPLYGNGDHDLLRRADLVVALDVRDPYGLVTRTTDPVTEPERVVPARCRLVDVGYRDVGIRSWSQEFQKVQPVDLLILGDAGDALEPLLQRCRQLAGPQDRERFAERFRRFAAAHAARRQTWRQEVAAMADWEPIAPAYLVAEVGEAIAGSDWVLTANTVQDWARRLWAFDRPYRHPGKSLGTATQIGISLGVALAHRGSGRLVVDLQPDGDLLFDAGALWTAAYHRIPLLVVMYNNRAYYNDWDHQIKVARVRGRDEKMAYLGMELDHPAPDFAALARSLGWYAEGPVLHPGDIRAAVARARDVVLQESRPALVDVVTRHR